MRDPKAEVHEGLKLVLRCQGPIFTKLQKRLDQSTVCKPEDLREVVLKMCGLDAFRGASRLATMSFISVNTCYDERLMAEWKDIIRLGAAYEARLTAKHVPDHMR